MSPFEKQLDIINHRIDTVFNNLNALKKSLLDGECAEVKNECPTYHADLLTLVDTIQHDLEKRKTVTVIGNGRSTIKVERVLSASPCGCEISEEE